jgi:hypothetical protein
MNDPSVKVSASQPGLGEDATARVSPEVEEQVRSLLHVVEVYRLRRCEEILAAAQAQSTQLVQQAYREARQHLHVAVLEERQRGRDEMAAVEAQLQTQRRQRQQGVAAAMLRHGWERLRAELLRRWRDPAARRLWVEGLLQQALKVLPGSRWRLSHPQDWPEEEQGWALAFLQAHFAGSVEFHPDPALPAGLRVQSGGTCLDGTLGSLLADRREVEARLLDLWQADKR